MPNTERSGSAVRIERTPGAYLGAGDPAATQTPAAATFLEDSAAG